MGTEDSGLKAAYAAHRAELLRFLTARTGDAAEAEDVLQDLWIKLGRDPGGPVAQPRPYLYRMAQNLVLDRVRERRRRSARDQAWSDSEFGRPGETGEVADPGADAEAALAARGEAARLARAIEALPEGARRVLRLHKIDGLSQGEVAARLGISRSGVEKHMAVAMAHLRRALGD